MENKQTAPKEIWIDTEQIKEFNECRKFNPTMTSIFISDKPYKVHVEQVKYLSETHVNELLAEKDRRIEGQRETIQSFKDRYYELFDTLDSKNKMLAEKDREIEELKNERKKTEEVTMFLFGLISEKPTIEDIKWATDYLESKGLKPPKDK